jgi:hypothetical protein
MLRRHGTRLDIGTAEDVAELNAAEALLRASYKPPPMGTGSSSGGGSDVSAFHARATAPYNLPGAMARPAAATTMGVAAPSATGGRGEGGTTPTAYYYAGGAPSAVAAPPPHVHLGHSEGRASPATTSAAGVGAPTPASASSSASVHAQRALYRSGGVGGSDTTVLSPSGRPSAASTMTGYASPSSRTPGGIIGGGSVMRGTAQPLFHSPHSLEDGDEAAEEEEAFRGRPSMRRAPFAVPVPVASATAGAATAPTVGFTSGPDHLPPSPASGAARQPYTRRGVSSAAPLSLPSRYVSATSSLREGPEEAEGYEEGAEEEGVPAQSSRVSGRYQLPRSPGYSNPSSS